MGYPDPGGRGGVQAELSYFSSFSILRQQFPFSWQGDEWNKYLSRDEAQSLKKKFDFEILSVDDLIIRESDIILSISGQQF